MIQQAALLCIFLILQPWTDTLSSHENTVKVLLAALMFFSRFSSHVQSLTEFGCWFHLLSITQLNVA